MPNTTGGRKRGSGNYSDAELTHMYDVLEEVRPIGPIEWQQVSDKHAEKFPGRDADSIRRKYASHHRQTIPTGDPKCLWYVKRAKKVKYLIGLKAEFGDGEDVFDIETGVFNNSRSEDDDEVVLEEEDEEQEQQDGTTQQSSQGTTQQFTQRTTQQFTQGTTAPRNTQQQFAIGPPLAQPSQLTGEDADADNNVPRTVTVPVPRTPTRTRTTTTRRRTPTPTTEHSSASNSSSRRSIRTRSPTGGVVAGGEATALLGAIKSCIEIQMQHLAQQTKIQERAEARADRAEARAIELHEQAIRDAREAREEARQDRYMLMRALQNGVNIPTQATTPTASAAPTPPVCNKRKRITSKKNAKRKLPTYESESPSSSDSSVSISE